MNGLDIVLCVLVCARFVSVQLKAIDAVEEISKQQNKISSEDSLHTDQQSSVQISTVINFEQDPRRIPKSVLRTKRQESNSTAPDDDEPFFDEIPSTTQQPPVTSKTRISIDLGDTPTSSDEDSSSFKPPFRIFNIINPGKIFNTGVVAARKTAQNAVEFASKQVVTVSEAMRNIASDIGRKLNFRSTICRVLLGEPGCKFEFNR
ncbi:uncharacterized protein [Euwallacea fornicatus]|uniref:uncharacterized protein n=1 Tax=Euwallacea fornicatus TaxID=995702 RepID=UPI00338EE99A